MASLINDKNLSFVITSYKSEENILNCLNSIPEEYEKIIIENSNDHKLKKKLEDTYKNLKCYPVEENLGYGTANNKGIKYSKKEYIFIVNPDVVFTEKTLNKIFKILKNQDFSVAGFLEKNNLEENSFTQNKHIIKEVDFVRGFAMVLNMKKMFNILFDEKIFLYLEEIDLCKRVKDKGGKIILLDIFIDHLGGKSHGNQFDLEMEKSRNWHWMWSLFYYNKKHKGYIYSIIKTSPKFLVSVFKYFLYFILINKKKREIYKMRMLGLFNSYLLNKSFYRPFKD